MSSVRSDQKPKVTADHEYLATLSSSPYVMASTGLVRVEGRSTLKGSWKRARA